MKVSVALQSEVMSNWSNPIVVMRRCQDAANQQLTRSGGMSGDSFIFVYEQVAAAQQIGLQLGQSDSPGEFLARIGKYVKTRE